MTEANQDLDLCGNPDTESRKFVYGRAACTGRADRKRAYVKDGDPHPFVLIVEGEPKNYGGERYFEFDATSVNHARALLADLLGRTAAIWFVNQDGSLAGEYHSRKERPFGGIYELTHNGWQVA